MKFKVGDKVIGNENAYVYDITREGWIGAVIGTYTGCNGEDMIKVVEVCDNCDNTNCYDVESWRFNLYARKKINNKIKGDNNMNKNDILRIYEERKQDEIIKRLNDEKNEEIENDKVIKTFKQLNIEYNEKVKSLLELEEFKDYIIDHSEVFSNDYVEGVYEIDISKVKTKINDKYEELIREEIDKLDKLCDEVQAMLSLSDDVDYVKKVLKDYGIIGKNGKINA